MGPRALVAAKNATDWHCPTPLQLAVAELLSEGHLARHVRKMRARYQERRRALLGALEEQCAARLVAIPSSYGLHVTAVTPTRAPPEKVTQGLFRHHIRLHSLARYVAGSETQSGLVFGLGAVEVPAIERCVALVRRALGDDERRARGPRAARGR